MGIVQRFSQHRLAQTPEIRNKRKQRDLDRDKSLDNINRRPTPPGWLPQDWERPEPVWQLWKGEGESLTEFIDQSTNHDEMLLKKQELESALLPGEWLTMFIVGG